LKLKEKKNGIRKYKKSIEVLQDSSNLEKNRLELSKIFLYLKNIRQEYVKYCVSHLLSQYLPKYVAIEDLNVSGMMKNRHLSKAIQNQNFYYTRQTILSKCKKLGIEVRLVNRFYPSSKTCNSCGCINKELKLKDRIFNCNDCGSSTDRDLNASLNLRDTTSFVII